MSKWVQLFLSSGQSLFVLGALEVMWTISNIFQVYALGFHKNAVHSRKGISDANYHLRYLEWVHLCLESSKLVWTGLFWVGGLIAGKSSILKGWIYITASVEVVLQVLVWVLDYHHNAAISTTTPPTVGVGPILRFTYSGIIRLLIRSFFILVVLMFLRKTEPSREEGVVEVTLTNNDAACKASTSTSEVWGSGPLSVFSSLPTPPSISMQLAPIVRIPTDIDLLPVGSGVMNTLRFYYADIDLLVKLLLTIDLGWGVMRILEKEVTQILFDFKVGPLPSSSLSTPLFAEERIIRTFRLIFDVLFLSNIHHDKPPLSSQLIIPKIVEIVVSVGILVFLRVVEYRDYAAFIFTVFYIFFIFDIAFRILTFIVCYKAYGDFLCRRHRSAVTAVANLKLTKTVTQGLNL